MEGGGGLPVRLHSYRGHIVWNYGGSLIGQKATKSSSSRVDNSGVPVAFLSGKNRHDAF